MAHLLFLSRPALGVFACCLFTSCGPKDVDSTGAAEDAAKHANDTNKSAESRVPAHDEAMPDREQDPLAYLYWRMDRVFEESDKDGDGFLDITEYRAPGGTAEHRQATFVRLDGLDGTQDGKIAKESMIGEAIARNPAAYGL